MSTQSSLKMGDHGRRIPRSNKKRLQLARRLNLDLTTLSISETTSGILFHGMTDEEMDMGNFFHFEQHEIDDTSTCFGIYDVGMWKSFMENSQDGLTQGNIMGVDLSPVMEIASKIVYHRGPGQRSVTHGDVRKAIKDLHVDLVLKLYPVDAVLSVLEEDPESIDDDTTQIRGSEGDGLIDLNVFESYIENLRPDDMNFERWENIISAPLMRSLHEFRRKTKSTSKLIRRLQDFRQAVGLPSDIPRFVRRYLETRPFNVKKQHWVAVLDRVHETFGYYEEVDEPYLVPNDTYDGDVWCIERMLARNKKEKRPFLDASEDESGPRPAKKRRLSAD